MNIKKIVLSASVLALVNYANAQAERWQQKVKYTINADMNVKNNRLAGAENITYWNNSPDTLHKMFVFLYWNAFQPNSMMDVRSRELGKRLLGQDRKGNPVYDWDARVRDRIQNLKPDEIGYQHIHSFKINGVEQKSIVHGTVMEVDLSQPILPNSNVDVAVNFEAQVPLQIRRSGRDNEEGVRYSMSQWYPKIAEYDYEGWNPNPYIGREFYGVYGSFDVHINIDKNYLVAGTGTVQNPKEVGFGYAKGNGKADAQGKKHWHFTADNVHDFVWAADDHYKMISRKTTGPLLYFVYKDKGLSADSAWNKVADTMAYAYPYIAKTFGAYPYQNYSFIQGGDGGMEYPMATLIKDAGQGTAFHEWMHSWYQGVMGSNESLYPFMDEGGATYGESRITGWLHHSEFPFMGSYMGYLRDVKSGLEEPMTTHSDWYNTNFAYGQAAYSKGCLFYEQLSYIMGQDNMDKFLINYYNTWKFKHPNPNDFIRVAEKTSGLELQWYKENWIGTTRTIDYAIGDVSDQADSTIVTLKNLGTFPMPIDLVVTYDDGSQELHYIPTGLTFGNKPAENDMKRFVHAEWPWVNSSYNVTLSHPKSQIKSINIDPSMRMADIDRKNNKVEY